MAPSRLARGGERRPLIFDAAVGNRTLRVEVSGSDGRYRVSLDGRLLNIDVRDIGRSVVSVLVKGKSYEVGIEGRGSSYTATLRGEMVRVELAEAARGVAALRKTLGGPVAIVAPMPGRLLRILVEEGQEVREGEGLLVMEAMKMENELRCPRAGRVREIHAQERQAVETGALLVTVE